MALQPYGIKCKSLHILDKTLPHLSCPHPFDAAYNFELLAVSKVGHTFCLFSHLTWVTFFLALSAMQVAGKLLPSETNSKHSL